MCCWASLKPDSRRSLKLEDTGMGKCCCSETHIFSGIDDGLMHSMDSSCPCILLLRTTYAEEGCLSESGGVGNMVEEVLPEHWVMGGETNISPCSDPECTGVGIPPHSDSTERTSDEAHIASTMGEASVSLAAGEMWLSKDSAEADRLRASCEEMHSNSCQF